MVMSLIESLARIKNAVYGREVREAIHDGVFRANQIADGADAKADNTQIRQDAVEDFNNQVIQEMTDKDIISAPEIIQARGAFEKLGDRVTMIEQSAEEANEYLSKTYVYITKFGAKGDGIHDDAPALRMAIESLRETGGDVLLPLSGADWRMASKGVDGNIARVPSGVRIIGRKMPTDKPSMRLNIDVDDVNAVFYYESGSKQVEAENLYINCNGKADYAFLSDGYISNFNFKNIRTNLAIEGGFKIQGYLGGMVNVTNFKTKIGAEVNGGTSGGTSVVLDRVYGIECDTNIKLDNMTYSQLTTCASDRNIIGYHLINCKGITIINPGIEDAITTDTNGKLVNYQPFLIERSKNITLINPSFIVSPSVPGYVIPSLIKLVDVETFNIESTFINFLNYDKVLKIEGNSTKIQVNDRSFDSGRVQNDSTSSSSVLKSVQYMGYKADSAPQNRWTAPLYSGWTGELRYTRNGTGTVTVYGSITGGTITAGTRIGDVAEGYRPPVNWMVEVVNASTLTPVGAKLIIKPDGDIVIPPGQTLVAGTLYNFGTSYERHV